MVSPSPSAAPCVTLDSDAEAFEQFGHGPHIGQPRHIGEDERLGRQQRRRHQLQGGILGAADGDFARQAGAAANANPVHGLPLEGPKTMLVARAVSLRQTESTWRETAAGLLCAL